MSRSTLLPCLGFLLTATLAACSSTPAAVSGAPAATPAPAATGYLQGDAVPDSLALSPPPPAAGTPWAALDDAVAQQALAWRDSPRFRQAAIDADLSFPGGAEQFSCALGIPVNEQHTPVLMRLLLRSLISASASTKAAKNHYLRPRPFLLNGQPTCTPHEEERLRDSGSYPSGHTAIGWTWALVLSEIAPERSTALLERGRNYGHSRLVCNVHWYSDIKQGETMAAAAVARLHDNAEFRADLAEARREIEAVRKLNLPLSRDCAAEADVLKIDLPAAR